MMNFILLTFTLLLPVTSFAEDISDHKIHRVLVLHSSDSEFYWNLSEAQGIRDVFSNAPLKYQISSEFLDLQNYRDKEYSEAMAKLMLEKYKPLKSQICGLLLADDPAVIFFQTYLKDFFSSTPTVALGVNQKIDFVKTDTFDFLYEETGYEETLKLIKDLHPNLTRIVVLSDLSLTGLGQLENLRVALGKLVIPWVEIGQGTFEETAERLSRVTKDEVVVRLVYYKDSTEKILNLDETMKLIMGSSPVPVYTFWEGLIGMGPIGGNVISGVQHGKKAALKLQKLMNHPVNQEPDSITERKFVFDYKQLERFSINIRNIPKDSVIVNEPYFFYRHYWKLTWSISGVILGLLLFVGGLAYINRRLYLARKELLIAKENADLANAAKSRFLAMISHEIRTPLTAVLGFSELLCGDDLTNEKKKYFIDVINHNGRQLSNLINDLLDISRIEAGQIDIQKTNVNLRELCREIFPVFDLRAKSKMIDFIVSSKTPLPLYCFVDSTRVHQIVSNLVGNAIKFTEKGFIKVEIAHLKKSIDGTQKDILRFLIQDTGIGLSDEQAKGLFQLFHQVDSTEKRKFGGAGIGLALSRKIASGFGGTVELLNHKLGVGCTFEFICPIENPNGNWDFSGLDSLIESTETITSNTNKHYLINGRRLNVLVAEDNVNSQQLISMFLKDAGHHVDVAENGAVAVKKAFKQNYDVIIMDLEMPELDGLGATRELRSKGFTKPIIALTAHVLAGNKEDILGAGCNELIFKPVRRDTLLEKLHTIQN